MPASCLAHCYQPGYQPCSDVCAPAKMHAVILHCLKRLSDQLGYHRPARLRRVFTMSRGGRDPAQPTVALPDAQITDAPIGLAPRGVEKKSLRLSVCV